MTVFFTPLSVSTPLFFSGDILFPKKNKKHTSRRCFLLSFSLSQGFTPEAQLCWSDERLHCCRSSTLLFRFFSFFFCKCLRRRRLLGQRRTRCLPDYSWIGRDYPRAKRRLSHSACAPRVKTTGWGFCWRHRNKQDKDISGWEDVQDGSNPNLRWQCSKHPGIPAELVQTSAEGGNSVFNPNLWAGITFFERLATGAQAPQGPWRPHVQHMSVASTVSEVRISILWN